MAEVAKTLGANGVITHKGKEYQLSPFNWEMVGDFETWLEDRAVAKVERLRGIVPDDVYRERLETVYRLIAAETFGSGKPAFAEAMKSLAGQKRVIFLMMRANDRSVTPALVDEVCKEMFADLMLKVGELNRDPDPTTAKAEQSPSPPS